MKNERISSLVTTSTCNELKVKLGECNSFVSSIALLFRRSRDAGAAAAAVSPPRPPTAASDQLNLQLVRRIARPALSRAGEKAADIYGLSYNSTRDELFFADDENKAVRAMHLQDGTPQLQDVYRGSAHDTSPWLCSVCHLSDTDTLLVCSSETIRRKARQLAGGTESQRQRVARDAPPADRREGMAVLRAE